MTAGRKDRIRADCAPSGVDAVLQPERCNRVADRREAALLSVLRGLRHERPACIALPKKEWPAKRREKPRTIPKKNLWHRANPPKKPPDELRKHPLLRLRMFLRRPLHALGCLSCKLTMQTHPWLQHWLQQDLSVPAQGVSETPVPLPN